MIGALDLQKMLFERLANDVDLMALLGGSKIYDTPPRRVPLPYISFGVLSAVDWSTSEDAGGAYIVSLNCWSEKSGRKQALEIASKVSELLDQPFDLPITTGVRIVLVQPLGMSVQNDASTKTIRATLRHRILVEPIQ